MRVRLLHKLRRGTVLDLVPADARRLIDGGMAEEVAPAPAPPPPTAAPIEPEAASLPPAPERATAPRARGRG